MAKPDDGGSAFPHSAGTSRATNGMSMRDWFAGRAMQGFMLGLAEVLVDDSNAARVAMAIGNTARLAYVVADAMLKERARG